MTTTIVVLIVVVLVAAVVIAIGFVARRAGLQRRFGPEYDRAVADNDGRLAAERELRSRERRHAKLELRPLDQAARERFAEQWRTVQTQFVLDPAAAVVAGDRLVTELVQARGYPTENYDDQLEYLSVEHARPLNDYGAAHDIFLRSQRGQASTEELRQALVHYRQLVADLLDESPQSIVDGSNEPAQSTEEVHHDRA
jgi:hypothetical protein